MVALTGIEPANRQSSSVQLGLSVCKHVQLVSPGCSGTRYEPATLSLGCHSMSPGCWTELLARNPRRDFVIFQKRSRALVGKAAQRIRIERIGQSSTV